MNDRELLEMAAKAAGIDARKLPHAWPDRFDDDQWNPLIDDGDALRLAVRLELTIDWDSNEKCAYIQFEAENGETVTITQWDSDGGQATRRAIVRAAAEIGRSMP